MIDGSSSCLKDGEFLN